MIDNFIFLTFQLAVLFGIGALGAVMNEARGRSRYWGFAIGFLFGIFGIAGIALAGYKEIR